MRCSRTSTSSRSYAPALHRAAGRRPHLQDGLRADAAAALSSSGADVTVGCIEVPRDGGDRLRRDARRRRPTASSPSSRSRPTRPAMPDQPDRALASMGIYVFDTEFLIAAAAARRRRSELLARFRQGHHPAHRRSTARRWRTASRESCVRSARRDRALLARRRHGRCLLGSQYRPDRRRARARPLRPATGRSGPMPRSRRRPIRP